MKFDNGIFTDEITLDTNIKFRSIIYEYYIIDRGVEISSSDSRDEDIEFDLNNDEAIQLIKFIQRHLQSCDIIL